MKPGFEQNGKKIFENRPEDQNFDVFTPFFGSALTFSEKPILFGISSWIRNPFWNSFKNTTLKVAHPSVPHVQEFPPPRPPVSTMYQETEIGFWAQISNPNEVSMTQIAKLLPL